MNIIVIQTIGEKTFWDTCTHHRVLIKQAELRNSAETFPGHLAALVRPRTIGWQTANSLNEPNNNLTLKKRAVTHREPIRKEASESCHPTDFSAPVASFWTTTYLVLGKVFNSDFVQITQVCRPFCYYRVELTWLTPPGAPQPPTHACNRWPFAGTCTALWCPSRDSGALQRVCPCRHGNVAITGRKLWRPVKSQSNANLWVNERSGEKKASEKLNVGKFGKVNAAVNVNVAGASTVLTEAVNRKKASATVTENKNTSATVK